MRVHAIDPKGAACPGRGFTVAESEPTRSAVRDTRALTSLRIVAALWVVAFHFGAGAVSHLGAPAPLQHVLNHGYLGVSFFFVLSGFILAFVYEGTLVDGTSRRHFGLARFARIYPVYALALVAILPFEPPANLGSITLAPLLLHMWMPVSAVSHLAWNDPGWTLSVEFLFYVVFALLSARLWRLRTETVAMIATLAVVVTCALDTAATSPTGFPHWLGWMPLPIVRLPEFILGACSAVLFLRAERPRAWGSAWIATFGLAVGGAAALGGSIGSRLAPVLFAGLVVASANAEGWVQRLLSHRLLVLLGGASYAVYLLQRPIHDAVVRVGGDTLTVRGGAILVIIATSVVVYRWYEEPVRRRIRRRGVRPEIAAQPALALGTSESPA